MNALRNKVQLIGRLGKDAETITFDDGKVKARFPVATNETFRNSEGEKVERTQWHDVVAWGGLAEVAGQYLKKGAEVAVEGRLTYRTYEDGEGQTRYITEVVAGRCSCWRSVRTCRNRLGKAHCGSSPFHSLRPLLRIVLLGAASGDA